MLVLHGKKKKKKKKKKKIPLKNIPGWISNTPKTTDQNILFLNERIPFNLHCRFNEVVLNY